MSYYEDLSPYNYHHHCELERNIGWLQKDQTFNTGPVPEGFLEKLKWFDEKPFTIFHTLGSHRCEFCDGQKASGSHEIRVVGKGSSTRQDILDNIVYACPSLIIHYIEVHNYLPPQEFIDAVLNCRENMVGPGQDKYTNILRKLPESWQQRKPDLNDEDYLGKMESSMVKGIAEEIDKNILNDILSKNPDFLKFVNQYKKIMPHVYRVNNEKNNNNTENKKLSE